MLSISRLFDVLNEFRGRGSRRQGSCNAPMFAWSVSHNGDPPPFIPGQTATHSVKVWNGIEIDSAIPLDSIRKLNEIPGIQIRATCQGHHGEKGSPDINSYMIFRTTKQNESYVANIVSKLNSIPDIKAGYGIGSINKFRIAVVSPFSYDSNPTKFEKWWKQLPNIIANVL